MTSWGLWLSKKRLVAVVVDDDGRASPALFADRNDEARWELLASVDAVHGLDCELVLPEEVVQVDSIGNLALKRGASVSVAPQRLVEAIRLAAGLSTGPPARIAAMVARLTIVPGFRGHLRKLNPRNVDRQQLPLL